MVPPWVIASCFLAGNTEAELKPTISSSLLLFCDFLSFLFSLFLALLPADPANIPTIRHHFALICNDFQTTSLVQSSPSPSGHPPTQYTKPGNFHTRDQVIATLSHPLHPCFFFIHHYIHIYIEDTRENDTTLSHTTFNFEILTPTLFYSYTTEIINIPEVYHPHRTFLGPAMGLHH